MRSKAFWKLTTVFRNLRVMKNIYEKDEDLFSYLETDCDVREARTRKTKNRRKKNDTSCKAVGFSMNRIAILIFFIVNLELYVV
jgi:hypothetical protein